MSGPVNPEERKESGTLRALFARLHGHVETDRNSEGATP